jgi:hypothetical protein
MMKRTATLNELSGDYDLENHYFICDDEVEFLLGSKPETIEVELHVFRPESGVIVKIRYEEGDGYIFMYPSMDDWERGMGLYGKAYDCLQKFREENDIEEEEIFYATVKEVTE